MDENKNPFDLSNSDTPAANPFMQTPAAETPAQPAAAPVQPTYYTQPGNSYIPPVTAEERANTTVPSYVPNVTGGANLEEPLSVGQWMLTMLVMLIPCVNIIMMFVWAFGSGNKSRSNYCKASLLWVVIWIGISVLLTVLCGISFASLM